MKETPILKVPEAWTAVADGRVNIELHSTINEGTATVSSSDRVKEYTIRWRDGGRIFSSTDSATYWQGYAGYPILAVLMKQGRLTADTAMLIDFKGVEWKAINTRFRNKYDRALAFVEEERHLDSEKVRQASEKVLEELYTLNLQIKRKV